MHNHITFRISVTPNTKTALSGSCIFSTVQVDKAEQDKQSAIIKAQGEATSARLIGEAIQQNPAFITLRKIEAARDIAGTISGAANKVFLSSDSLLLNLVSAGPCTCHPAWPVSTMVLNRRCISACLLAIDITTPLTAVDLQGEMDVLGQPRLKQPR